MPATRSTARRQAEPRAKHQTPIRNDRTNFGCNYKRESIRATFPGSARFQLPACSVFLTPGTQDAGCVRSQGPNRIFTRALYHGVMSIRLKRWNDPRSPSDGYRVLICRYRPRALPKSRETWDEWIADAGPSRDLHADYYGKHGPPIGMVEYKRRYLAEMRSRPEVVEKLASLAACGPISLLCS